MKVKGRTSTLGEDSLRNASWNALRVDMLVEKRVENTLKVDAFTEKRVEKRVGKHVASRRAHGETRSETRWEMRCKSTRSWRNEWRNALGNALQVDTFLEKGVLEPVERRRVCGETCPESRLKSMCWLMVDMFGENRVESRRVDL